MLPFFFPLHVFGSVPSEEQIVESAQCSKRGIIPLCDITKGQFPLLVAVKAANQGFTFLLSLLKILILYVVVLKNITVTSSWSKQLNHFSPPGFYVHGKNALIWFATQKRTYFWISGSNRVHSRWLFPCDLPCCVLSKGFPPRTAASAFCHGVSINWMNLPPLLLSR